jgi:catechol-2,3-dioxygenase
MPVRRMNHAVLYVRDARNSARFYSELLDFDVVSDGEDGKFVFMRAPGSDNDHDIAFMSIGDDAESSKSGEGQVGLYHLGWEVATLGDLVDYRRRLTKAGALVGESNHEVDRSIYARDADGIEFELQWIVPPDRLDADADRLKSHPLDLEADIARFGADLPGGTAGA